jgi:hypothetical protein
MDVYKAKVRLTGSMLNEVRREELTAPEILLLQRIHGGDAVLEIEKTGTAKVNHREERERLYLGYRAAINNKTQTHFVEELFGPNHMDLPTSVPGVAVKKSNKGPTAAEIME